MPGYRHGSNDAGILGHGYPLTNVTGRQRLLLSYGFSVDRAIRPVVRRDDRVPFPPLRLRGGNSEAVVDLVAGFGQDSRDDARPEGSAVNADARADLHALALSIRKNRDNEALVAIEKRGQRVPCIDMPAGCSTHVQDFAAGGSPHAGSSQCVPSLLLFGYETLVIFQNRGKLLFLDFHSLLVKVDVPPLLDETTDRDQIISHIDAFSQGIELGNLLIELRVFGVAIMQRGRILLGGWLEHINARGVA